MISKAYLARSPWANGYYSQVSYINTQFENIAQGVWYGATAEETANDENIGWKVDKKSAENLSAIGYNVSKLVVLSDRMTNREYNGRYVILNRVFNTKTSIGDALTVSDYDGATSATWEAKAYSEITLEHEIAGAVTVDANGTTTKTGTGNVYVKVTATKGDTSDSVIVYSVVATGISLSETEATVAVGSSKTLAVSFEPFGASADVEWASDNANVTVSDGVVNVGSGAAAGSTATITATIKGTDKKATCVITVAAAVSLKKFGTSVEGVSLEGYTKFGGDDEFLLYAVPVTPGEGASASISATVETKGGQSGLGFVSFRDGAYKDGKPDGYMFATDQGVRYKKSYDAGWNGGWNASPDKKPYDDSSSGATYKITATLNGTGVTVSLVNVETNVEYAYSNSNVRNFIANGDLYLAIGGQTDKNESLNVNEVRVMVGEEGGTVARMEDLPADPRTALSASGTLSYEMTAEAFSTYKGMEDAIVMANVATSGLSVSPATEGTWSWDVASVKNSGADFTARATFIPKDRASYKAILSHEVSVSVTDSRNDAPGAVITETFKLGSGMTRAEENPGDEVVSASDISWVNNTGSTESGLAEIGSNGTIYIPKDLVEASADYSYATTISVSQAAKIIAVKAEAGSKGSTGNVQIDAFISVDGGTTWQEIGSLVSNSTKAAYKPLNYSGEIDVASSAIIQFRPHWTAARSGSSYTTVTDLSITVQYSKKSEVAKVYDFTDASYSGMIIRNSGDVNAHISVAAGTFKYHSAQYGIESAAGTLLVLKEIATDTTNGKDIVLNFKLGYDGTATLVNPSNTSETYGSAATVKGATACTLNYKGESDTIGILLSNKQYIGSLSLSVIE